MYLNGFSYSYKMIPDHGNRQKIDCLTGIYLNVRELNVKIFVRYSR